MASSATSNIKPYAGWWFGTLFFCSTYIGNFMIPIDVHIFQRRKVQPPTRYGLPRGGVQPDMATRKKGLISAVVVTSELKPCDSGLAMTPLVVEFPRTAVIEVEVVQKKT